MRDQMDARLWNCHHEALSDQVGGAIERGLSALGRLNRSLPKPVKLAAALLAASLVAITAPPPALAGQTAEVPASVAISYADLDLGSEAGRQTLAARVEGAARLVCRPDTIGSLKERADRRACYRIAVGQSQAQLDRARDAARAQAAAIAIAGR